MGVFAAAFFLSRACFIPSSTSEVSVSHSPIWGTNAKLGATFSWACSIPSSGPVPAAAGVVLLLGPLCIICLARSGTTLVLCWHWHQTAASVPAVTWEVSLVFLLSSTATNCQQAASLPPWHHYFSGPISFIDIKAFFWSLKLIFGTVL